MVSSTPRPHFTPRKDPVPILQEAGLAPGTVWTGGKSRPRRDSIPDRQGCVIVAYSKLKSSTTVNVPQEVPRHATQTNGQVKVQLYAPLTLDGG